MEFAKNLVEYYDELFPVTHEQKQFFSELLTNYSRPAKILNVGCGTGFFDNMLAKEGTMLQELILLPKFFVQQI